MLMIQLLAQKKMSFEQLEKTLNAVDGLAELFTVDAERLLGIIGNLK